MDTRLITSSKYALTVTSFNKPFNHAPKNKYHTINLPLTLSALTLQPTIHKPDVLPSKNQELCDYCTLASKLKHCWYLIGLFPF